MVSWLNEKLHLKNKEEKKICKALNKQFITAIKTTENRNELVLDIP